MSASFELLPAISPPLFDNVVRSDVDTADKLLPLPPGITYFEADQLVYLNVVPLNEVESFWGQMPIEAQTPYLIGVAAKSQIDMFAATTATVRTYSVVGDKNKVEWVPMQAPEYVVTYTATSTPTIFDLGITTRAEIYISPAVKVYVAFDRLGGSAFATNPIPVYPASPMRFTLGPQSRRMSLHTDVGPTDVTISYIGKAR